MCTFVLHLSHARVVLALVAILSLYSSCIVVLSQSLLCIFVLFTLQMEGVRIYENEEMNTALSTTNTPSSPEAIKKVLTSLLLTNLYFILVTRIMQSEVNFGTLFITFLIFFLHVFHAFSCTGDRRGPEAPVDRPGQTLVRRCGDALERRLFPFHGALFRVGRILQGTV